MRIFHTPQLGASAFRINLTLSLNKGLLRIYCFFVLALVSHVSVKAQKADSLLSLYFQKVSGGNIENWREVKSVSWEEASYYIELGFQQNPFGSTHEKPTIYVDKVYWVSPDNFLRETFQDSVLTTRWVTTKGGRYYIFKDNPPVLVDKPSPFQFEPVKMYNIILNAKSIRWVGTESVDGILCHQIEFKHKGDKWKLNMDAGSNLLISWSMSNIDDFSTVTKYSDYIRVGKFMFPKSEQKLKNGVIFFSSLMQKIEINPAIDFKRFQL